MTPSNETVCELPGFSSERFQSISLNTTRDR